jgi:3-deoxy-D-manno-octulosonic-acid transferase
VDQLAYPLSILTLAFWQDQRPAYSAHTQERFGIATGDHRELGQVWSAQD